MRNLSASFPRVIKRGLIEAIEIQKQLPRFRSFPRVIKRGLIEATRWPPADSMTSAFPRVIKRGLIEACCRLTVSAT